MPKAKAKNKRKIRVDKKFPLAGVRKRGGEGGGPQFPPTKTSITVFYP